MARIEIIDESAVSGQLGELYETRPGAGGLGVDLEPWIWGTDR